MQHFLSGYKSFTWSRFQITSTESKEAEQVKACLSTLDIVQEMTTGSNNVNKKTKPKDTQKENRVISMSLYGSDPRYTKGAIANAKLIQKVFPGWTLRIYLALFDPERPVKMDFAVPLEIVCSLKVQDVEVVFIDPALHPVKNPRLWRFLVANDVTVDRFLIRDADSKLIPRDATEVQRWIQSGEAFQCMRDHPAHSKWAVNGGMWGAVSSKLFQYLDNRTFSAKSMSVYSDDRFQDQEFLRDVVWPRIKHHAYCSDSFSWKKWESSHPFARNWSKYEYVGQIWRP